MSLKAKAPKMEAFLERTYGFKPQSAAEWNAMCVGSTGLVVIDPRRTPIRGLLSKVPRTAVVAHRTGPFESRVSVYRYDPVDPKPWNVNHYSVLLDVSRSIDIDHASSVASTSCNGNLVNYFYERVHWREEPRSSDHWSEYHELPPLVQSLVGSSS
jgi:hypothetical protein